jgi:hypothetical protein
MKSIRPVYFAVLVVVLLAACLAMGVASRIARAQPEAARSALKITVEAIGESVEELDAGVYLAGTTREAAGVYEGGQKILLEAVAHNPDYWRFHKWTGALESSRNPCSLVTKLTGSTMKLTAQFQAHSMHDYTDLFKRPGMPADQWDIRPDTGFGMAKGALEAFGFHGPNTLGSTTFLQDLEMSVWFCYTDAREAAEIPGELMTLDIELRRTLDGSRRLFVRLTPRSASLMAQHGEALTQLGVHDDFRAESRAWSNLRARVSGNQARVWLRRDDGSWGEPVLSSSADAGRFNSDAYAITAHPDASYLLSNFRVRGLSGGIDGDIGAIDVHPLSIAVDPAGAAVIRPAGGMYPHGETVYLSAKPEPGMVLKEWEDSGGARVHNSSAENTRVTMESPGGLTVWLRQSHGGGGNAARAPQDAKVTPEPVTKKDGDS